MINRIIIYNRQMIGTIKQGHPQYITCFSNLMVLLAKYQNQLQTIRQLLTLNNDFNPQSLFKYLSMGQQQLTRAHIIYFIEQNNKQLRQEQARLLFHIYGYRDKLSYADFLDFIYPFDIQAIKTISKVMSKRYLKYGNQQPSQKILCIFLLLIQKQIQFLHIFDENKSQKLFPMNTVRESIKLIIKILKKYSTQPLGGISTDYIITFAQFKNIMEKLVELPQIKIQIISRRLSLQKEQFIGLDQLEIWLKPWFKEKLEEIKMIKQSPNASLKDITVNLIA